MWNSLNQTGLKTSICSFSHTCYKPLGSTKLYFWKIPSRIFLRIDLQRCLWGEVTWYLPRRGSVADRLTSYSKNIIISHKNIYLCPMYVISWFAKFCRNLEYYVILVYFFFSTPQNQFKTEKKSFIGQSFLVWPIRNLFSK